MRSLAASGPAADLIVQPNTQIGQNSASHGFRLLRRSRVSGETEEPLQHHEVDSPLDFPGIVVTCGLAPGCSDRGFQYFPQTRLLRVTGALFDQTSCSPRFINGHEGQVGSRLRGRQGIEVTRRVVGKELSVAGEALGPRRNNTQERLRQAQDRGGERAQ